MVVVIQIVLLSLDICAITVMPALHWRQWQDNTSELKRNIQKARVVGRVPTSIPITGVAKFDEEHRGPSKGVWLS